MTVPETIQIKRPIPLRLMAMPLTMWSGGLKIMIVLKAFLEMIFSGVAENNRLIGGIATTQVMLWSILGTVQDIQSLRFKLILMPMMMVKQTI